MGPNSSNALFFLVTTLFDLYLGALLLRVILQWVRADFYNPLSQIVWKLTNPPVLPLRNLIPRWQKLDTAALVVLLVVAVVYMLLIGWMFGLGIGGVSLVWYALLKCLVLTINLYTLSLFVQAILSWLGPGVNNPAANILWSMNEPLLRPVRRFIPSISGLDLSPLVVMLALQVLNRLIPLPLILR
ncbi:YggT family protein [Stagnimonas aquatica]|uniref:YggT family protein n=1 Tax=Stagnimonas aquatica TaxID=2689987 RepID=A0A3N0VG31_9GAMM|nr:YggT family protein [Stagnimonas aquatica]ROH91733.1 YggT family protein [Stagnimonas aquatica]